MLAAVALTGVFALAGATDAMACSAPEARGSASVVHCAATGGEQQFVVPVGVTSLRVTAIGASGGFGGMAFSEAAGSGGTPGVGAVAAADLPVTAGQTLYVLVGSTGLTNNFPGADGVAGAGGFNGGGSGGGQPGAGTPSTNHGSSGGGGGGASDIRTCSLQATTCDTLASRLIVAAGGGGGGGGSFSNDFSEGGGGGAAGTDGDGHGGVPAPYTTPPPASGGGATREAGGAGAPGAAPGGRGAGGRGANGTASAPGAPGTGGGGGGGLFGGGGGASGQATPLLDLGAGGGGGSSFGPAGTTYGPAPVPFRADGSVTIAYSASNGPPAVTLSRPRANQHLRRFSARTHKRLAIVVSGRATDAQGVATVELAIERLPRSAAGRCTWLAGSRLRSRSCDQPTLLRARLHATGAWSYTIAPRAQLPAGRYRVVVRGTDKLGTSGNAAPAARVAVTFRLTQR